MKCHCGEIEELRARLRSSELRVAELENEVGELRTMNAVLTRPPDPGYECCASGSCEVCRR